MHKILTAMTFMILMTTAATAKVGGIDAECQAYGYDYGIVKYEWNGTAYIQEAAPKAPYVITLTGNAQAANWTASPPVAGVLHKAATDTFTHTGGSSGTITAGQHAISHVTFCGNDGTTVPESGILVGIISLLIPSTIYLARKKAN